MKNLTSKSRPLVNHLLRLLKSPLLKSLCFKRRMKIREATKEDWKSIWPIFYEIVSAGETYAYESDTTKEQGEKIWLEIPRKTFVFEENNEILVTYYLKTNQSGPGSHVCNCGYMVSSKARGRGLATLMCEHS